MIYFLLQDLPQKHPEHENLDNEDPALQVISELFSSICPSRSHKKERVEGVFFWITL